MLYCFCGALAEYSSKRYFGGILGQKGNIFLCAEHKGTTKIKEEYKFRKRR